MSETKMLFVVGSRRSGTLWLHRVLASHPDVAALPSETHLFSHGIAPLFDRFHHGATGSTLTGSIQVDRETILAHTKGLCDAVFEPYRQGAAYLLERTPLHVRELDLIREIYPDARIVHIIRDGRDVARSLAAQGWGPETVAEAAIEWRDSVQAGREAGQPADLYRELRYEALLADPDKEVAGLLGWLRLEAGPAAIATALRESRAEANVGPSQSPRPGTERWRQEWSDTEIAEFEAEAGGLLDELGYETGLAAHPRRRASSPSTAVQRLGSASRRRIRRLAGEAAKVDLSHLRQLLADELLAGLVSASTEQLDELLTENCGLELIDGSGRKTVRGPDASALLAEVSRTDPAFSSPQISGETRIGDPWSTTVVRFQAPGDGVLNRVICTQARGQKLENVAIYRLD